MMAAPPPDGQAPRSPMRPFVLQVALYASLDEVGACLEDPERLRAWQPTVLAASRHDETTLAVRRAVGSRAREELWRIERPTPETWLVVRPYGPASLTIRYELSRPDPRTHVAAHFTLAVPLWGRPLASWLGRRVRHEEADQLARLSALLAGEDIATMHAAPDPLGD